MWCYASKAREHYNNPALKSGDSLFMSNLKPPQNSSLRRRFRQGNERCKQKSLLPCHFYYSVLVRISFIPPTSHANRIRYSQGSTVLKSNSKPEIDPHVPQIRILSSKASICLSCLSRFILFPVA